MFFSALVALGLLSAPLSCVHDCGFEIDAEQILELTDGADEDGAHSELDHDGSSDCCNVCHGSTQACHRDAKVAAVSLLKLWPRPTDATILAGPDAVFRPPRF